MNDPTADEAKAAKRYMIVNLVRIVSVIELALGMAIAREAITGPYVLGVALAIAGVAGFFFAPYFLTKIWKAQDNNTK